MLVSRIKYLAELKGISINHLQKELGMGKSTIQSWNKCKAPAHRIQQVAKYFQVSTDYLLGFTDLPIPLYSHLVTSEQKQKLLFTLVNLELTDKQCQIIFDYIESLYAFSCLDSPEIKKILEEYRKYVLSQGATSD